MKKLSFIVMACLLALGLTQCKKNEPTNNNNDDNRVSITLTLDNGGQKVHPEEENGLANVVYDNGDVVYVGSDGKYVGYLTYNGTLFTGSINDAATEGQPLQFIFMGGQTIEGLTENSSTECTFNIGDQRNGLAVISGAASNEDFSLTNLSYTAYLRNKCALVRFDLGEVSTDAAITLQGLKTEATVGFDGTVTNLSTTGDITTYGTGSTRYAVVLSDQAAVTEGTLSAEGYEGTFSIPTAAYTNAFLTDATMTLTAAPIGPLATPLTLEAQTGGDIVVVIGDVGGKGGGVYPGSSKGGPGGGGSGNANRKYSVNNGEKTLIPTGTTTIPVNAGDKVQFYGNGTYGGDTLVVIVGCPAQTKVYGNIMSMIDETGYATLTTLQDQPGAFMGTFYMNANLTDASGLLLPATELGYHCYGSLFSGCTSLTTAPTLPATTLAGGCYSGMFQGCTSLTTAPTLPAETLASDCYSYMFYGCTSLTTAPALPVTELADYCYSSMFTGCTSLTTAPALPATTLAESCYSGMFSGCTSLVTAPTLPATTLAESCYSSMFRGCTSLTAAPTLHAPTLADWCYYEMFRGCTSLTTAPTLPATTLASNCYRSMFQGCTSLNNITCLATAGIDQNNSTYNWVNSVASTGTFNRASGATWPTGNNGIPEGWTLVPPVDLPAATVTTAPTAKTGVTAGQNEAIVNAGTAEGGTMMYMVNATQPASTDGFSATVPTAEGLTAGTYYVWYYVKADDSHTDSEISASGIEVTIDAAPTLADAFTNDAVVTVKVNTANSQWFGVTGTYTSGTYATTGIGSVLSPNSVSMTKDGSNLVATVTNSFNTYTVTFNSTDNTYMENATSSTLPWQMTELQSITINGVDITSQLTASPSETISLVNMGNSIEGTNFDVAGQGDSNDNGKQVNKFNNLTITAKNSKTIKEVALSYGSLSGNAGTLSASPGSYDGTNTITGINASSLTISSSHAAGVYISSVKIYY